LAVLFDPGIGGGVVGSGVRVRERRRGKKKGRSIIYLGKEWRPAWEHFLQ